LELAPLKEKLEKRIEAEQALSKDIHDLRYQVAKLDHEPLLSMISKNRGMMETLKDDLLKIKESLGNGSLSHHIQKLEVQLNMFKNDLQQQIYKMKEFSEQLYLKQLEHTDKLDYELAKMRKQEKDAREAMDRSTRDVKSLKQGEAEMREMMVAAAEGVCALVELESIASAMEQQDEVDRRN
jgi:hypothetical protein